MKIKVLDAMMGSGKTTRLIQDISNLQSESKVIYITPLLTECHRIAGTVFDAEDEKKAPIVAYQDCDGIEEYVYDVNHPLIGRRFRHPSYSGGSKMDNLLFQVQHGCNVVSTHSLFRAISPKVAAAIKENGYILVLDEVLSVYEEFTDLGREELNKLIENKILYVDEDKITLVFNKEKFGDTEHTRYQQIADLCEMKQLMVVDGKVVFWEFPISALSVFKEVWIATYLFGGSQMCAYLKTHNVEFEIERFGKKPSELRHLVKIVEDKKLNEIGDKDTALSKQQVVHTKTHNEQLRKNLNNFFRAKNKTKLEDRLWTTYKKASGEISGGRFAKSWLACTTKATNDWKSASHVAYLINLFVHPMIVKLLATKGSKMDLNLYALSEMVQFIWRSRIREGGEIQLYIPSKRMRNILVRWLNDEFEN